MVEETTNRVFLGESIMGLWITGLPFAAALAVVVLVAYIFCRKSATGDKSN